MRRHWIFRGIKFLALAALAVVVLGYLVMRLWNFVMPALTGWHTLGFGEALALLVLCRILFGGFRRGGWHGRGWRHRMRGRFEHLSPEERAQLREKMRARCGLGPETTSETPKPSGS